MEKKLPINYKEYHPDWKNISKNVREEAGNKCELCGAPNGIKVYRPKKGYKTLYPWIPAEHYDAGVEDPEMFIIGQPPVDRLRITKIILTVHHIDGDKNNNNRMNLLALCQKCHLRLDLQKHVAKRKSK